MDSLPRWQAVECFMRMNIMIKVFRSPLFNMSVGIEVLNQFATHYSEATTLEAYCFHFPSLNQSVDCRPMNL